MRRQLGIGCCALGLALPAVARADGGPVPAVTGGTGASAPGAAVNYVTLAAKRGTIVERVDRSGGAVKGYRWLPGRLAVPGAAWDGSTTGLSADGRTLVLDGSSSPRHTRLAVLDARHLRVRSRISLRGYFTVDAISPDGHWLYLIHYRSAGDILDYEVQAYDVRARRLLAKPIVDPREPDEKMVGIPISRTTSADGRWVYTLYSPAKDVPFVHALDTSGRAARCIDLPTVSNDLQGVDLRLAAGALVVEGPRGPEALVDTRTFAVRKPAAGAPTRRAAATHADAGDGGPPWALALVAAPLLLAAVALVARRRRRPRPVITVERRRQVTD